MALRERLRHEIREIGIVTLYFLVCFGIFLSLKKLLLEQYHVSIYVFHAAVIGALVVAKVVVVLEKTSFGGRFRDARLITHVIWRSLTYTAAVFVVSLAEQLGEVYLEKGSLHMAVSELWASKDFDHFLAFNLCVALSFLFYNTARELDRRLGAGSIRRLLFSKRGAEFAGPAE
jgi:hypothetical protein